MKKKFRLIFIAFILIVLGGVGFLGHCFMQSNFGIDRSNWLNAIFSWISVASAIFLGLIAYWQNERFKEESDLAGERTDKYQQDLVNINNRLIKIEENRESAYLAFSQGVVYVGNTCNTLPQIFDKNYHGAISKKGNTDYNDSTVFVLGITNQTNVPIRYFEINSMYISYDNYETRDIIPVGRYTKGGFIASPIIDKGEKVGFNLMVDGIKNLSENLPKGYEISIVMSVEVSSIYNRTIEQSFLLRLQTKNANFSGTNDRHLFWNYCYESDPKTIDWKE